MSSWRLSTTWSHFFTFASTEQASSAQQRSAPQAGPVPNREGRASDQRERECGNPVSASGPSQREALEVSWLLRCLPPRMQAALVPDLLALKRSRPLRGALPVNDYTWPDVSGVRRPRYPGSVLRMKTLEGLSSRLRDELTLGVMALCAQESDLPRPMRNALLAMQGRRLGQVAEMLAYQLQPEQVLLLLRQELAVLR